ncbi:MAG: NADH-quinone oxidoreductase subunit NuoG, partial [Chloroflexi bacterium]|nr:NADH-quinone oxidoreductase subunit NuoG [Chloroflexota bacterium]
MEDLVTVTVDGREMRVPKGTLLWEACKAHGIDIPIFCYHTKLGPVGACRTCLVEQEGMTKGPITACSTPVTDGMKVHTRSPVVEKAQRGIFEFLLANHPLDCPICDKGGECPLQDQTFSYGPGASRYIEPKRHHEKPIVLGPTIALDRERCVLCWRCVRFCSEVAEDNSIVLLDRGEHTVVGTFHDEPYVSNFSGNVVELCPVGALTSRKQRFNFRPWELRNRPSVCPHCPLGCNINISVRKNDEVIRFLSRDNPEVDDSWLCDRGRFNYEFINSPERLASPLIRRDGAFVESSWTEALDLIASRLKPILEESGPDAVAGLASPRLTNEDLFVFRRFMTDVIGTDRLDHYPRPALALTDQEQGAMRDLDSRLTSISALDGAKTIVLLGADPSRREPVMELRIRLAMNRHGAKLLVISPEEITLSARAHATLSYPVERFADFVRALTAQVSGGRSGPGAPAAGSAPSPQALQDAVDTYLREGPVAVLYDDSFDGVEAKGDALLAVAGFVNALAGAVEVGTIPMLDDCNSMGARDLDIVPRSRAQAGGGGSWGAPVLSTLLSPDSQLRAAFLLGADIAGDADDPAMARRLRQLDLLVVHELMLTETAKYADVILPAASFAEKLGSFTNTERRIQALSIAVPSPGIARADWEILVDLSQYFDNPLDYALPRDIWEDIRRAVPAYAGVSYDDLGQRGVRPSV